MFNEDGELDLTNNAVRLRVLEGIGSEDNFNRKRDQQKRYDVYNGQQDKYILERLNREFSRKTVQEMRKILSINLAKRIIDEKSSVYNDEPERTFFTKSGKELTEAQVEQLNALYRVNNVNTALMLTNISKTRHDQCLLMCVPDNKGKIKVRQISPMHVDVIPSANDPEQAYAVILNVWDKDTRMTAKNQSNEPTQMQQYKGNDRLNQEIADDDDAQAVMERYIVWTKDFHFVMNGKGKIVREMIPNPIGILPFIDVAPPEKDFQFWVRRGSNTIDFSLDYGMMLSDNANVIRLQAYSQAVIASEKVPENLTIGPNHVLHLKLDPKRPELSPRFEFVTPNPDLSGTQKFMEGLLNLHLTAEGQDPSIISTTSDGQKFNSGLDRLLSMISKFEATRQDFALFRNVEDQLIKIMSAWSNDFQNVTGEGELVDELRLATLPDDVKVDVKFAEPEAVQTKLELEESVERQHEGGYMSRVEAVMILREINRDSAIEVIEQIDKDEKQFGELKEEVEVVIPDIQET